MEKNEKEYYEKGNGKLEGKILETNSEYVEGLGAVISLMIGFRRLPPEDEEKETEDA